jgi:hypothetical protein
MKTFRIFCDGGFGNRFSALIGGLALSKISGMPPKVSWPSNSVCRALFEDIFSNIDIEYDSKNIRDYYSNSKEYNLISNYSEYLKFFIASRTEPENLNIDGFLNLVSQSEKPVFYYTPHLYNWIPKEEISQIIKQLKFVDYIDSEVSNFIENNFGNSTYYGIHIRSTDFATIEKYDVDYYVKLVNESKDKKFFICSDDKKVEDRFLDLENCFVYKKREYVRKLYPEQDWRYAYTDSDGRYSVFNVERSKISVIDAIIDFLILSKSNIIKTGNESTFLKMAIILGENKK